MRYTTIGSDPSAARKVSVLSLGAMRFGTTTDEATSFAILDRYISFGAPLEGLSRAAIREASERTARS